MSLICSHVDSLTALKGATSILSKVQSYKKCSNVPKIETDINPKNCQNANLNFVISTAFFVITLCRTVGLYTVI